MRNEAPNTLLLHRYHQGELQGSVREQVRAAIESDPETRERYQALQANESAFAVQSLPPWLVQESRPSFWRTWMPVWAPMGALVAVGAAVLIAVNVPALTPSGVPGVDVADVLIEKGELPELEVWVDAGSGPRPLRTFDDGEVEALGEGAHVQLVFQARGRRFVTLAGRDGTGEIEVYDSIEVRGREGLIQAPFGLVLDDAPGPQEFFALGHDEPLTARDVQRHVEQETGDLNRVAVPKQ
ncbi:MAG: hypothetical protein AB8H79_03585 [Myxococcota bacterium]